METRKTLHEFLNTILCLMLCAFMCTTSSIAFASEGTPSGVSWGGFGSSTAQAVSGDVVPSGKLETAWTANLVTGDYLSTWSEPVIANSCVYEVRSNNLVKFDATSGAELASATLSGATAYGCRPLYVSGNIVVPLENGVLQAISATSMNTVWTTDALPAYSSDTSTSMQQQSLSSLFASDGRIYSATASADWSQTYDGYVICVDANSGDEIWRFHNEKAGFYWVGAAELGGYIVIGGDDGVVYAFSKEGNSDKPSAELSVEGGARIRSTMTTDGTYAYFTTTDGMLHKLAVSNSGEGTTLSSAGKASFASYTTSSPTISGGVAYVGGSMADGSGVLACINTSTMASTSAKVITQCDGSPLIGEVKSKPLVSVQEGETYVFFSCNNATGEWPNYTAGGGVYQYHVGDTQATTVFAPPEGYANYCMASIASGKNNMLYYVNDSGYLFSLKQISSPSDNNNADNAGNTTPDDPSAEGQGSDKSTESGNLSDTSPSLSVMPYVTLSLIAFAIAAIVRVRISEY